jgi:hypothetical protein
LARFSPKINEQNTTQKDFQCNPGAWCLNFIWMLEFEVSIWISVLGKYPNAEEINLAYVVEL